MQDSLPIHFIKYCPHCGSHNFVGQSPKEFKCSACGFNFFVNSAAAVAAIIVDDKGRILLTRRAREPWKGLLDLPGGFVDPDESVESALAREIMEELGAQICNQTYFYSSPNRYIFSNYTVYTTDMAFVCQLKRYDNLIAHDDVCQLLWKYPKDIDIDLIAAPSIKLIIAKYISLATQND